MMCRMIAFSSEDEIDVKPFFERLKKMAREGKRSPHPDGWGIFCVSGNQVVYLRNEKPIFESEIPGLKAKLCILHARKASPGTRKSVISTHPFLFLRNGKIHAFAHNGSLEVSKEELERTVTGVDTELMMEFLSSGDIEDLIEKFSGPSLTFLMSDGESLWAFRYCRKECDYYTLFLEEKEGLIVVSSEGNGRELDNGEIVVVAGGEIRSTTKCDIRC